MWKYGPVNSTLRKPGALNAPHRAARPAQPEITVRQTHRRRQRRVVFHGADTSAEEAYRPRIAGSERAGVGGLPREAVLTPAAVNSGP